MRGHDTLGPVYRNTPPSLAHTNHAQTTKRHRVGHQGDDQTGMSTSVGAQPKRKPMVEETPEVQEERRKKQRQYDATSYAKVKAKANAASEEAPLEADPSYGRAGGSKAALKDRTRAAGDSDCDGAR